MAVSRKAERELIRKEYLELVSKFLAHAGEEVLVVKSNEIAIPVVGCEEPDDGYALAEDYVHNLAEKERKAEERKAEKARKIARDAELRRKRAEIAEKGGK